MGHVSMVHMRATDHEPAGWPETQPAISCTASACVQGFAHVAQVCDVIKAKQAAPVYVQDLLGASPNALCSVVCICYSSLRRDCSNAGWCNVCARAAGSCPHMRHAQCFGSITAAYVEEPLGAVPSYIMSGLLLGNQISHRPWSCLMCISLEEPWPC